MRLYIIRHADPDYPNDTITEPGHKEAQALAKRLAREGLHRLYCSPLGRARDTARYTAEATHLEIGIEPWTRELGATWRPAGDKWNGCTAWDIPGEYIRGQTSLPTRDDWHALEAFSLPQMRQEFEHLKSQSDEFIARHGYVRKGTRYRSVTPSRDRIAVFCHGGCGLTWLAHLLELPLPLMWSGFWLPPTSVTTVLFDERSTEWAVPRCLGVGDVSHLYAEGLPVRPRGIKANYD
jgi:broad specificity phosphatase PhoE